MTRKEDKAENRQVLEAMAEEGKTKDSLNAYFAEWEQDIGPYMEALGYTL